MWKQLLLLTLVGLTAANTGYQQNKEYVYRIDGRTLTGLHDVADQYSGIVMRADLHVRPDSDGSLTAKIQNAKYSQIHQHLPDGWDSDIEERKMHYQPFQLSEESFKIVLKNGVVDKVVVNAEVPNFEANIIKSFVSQMQLDTQAENVVESHINQLPEEQHNSAVYKTMEDTVTGIYETLYEMAPLQKYIIQSEPWIAPLPHLKGDGELIEVMKTKNFSRAEERLGYYYGFGGVIETEPSASHMKDFFLRSSVSRAIISGHWKRYVIQSSCTTNKIVVKPTLNNEQNGMVVSQLNLTLSEVKSCSGPYELPSQTETLKSLSYTFNSPFNGKNKVDASGSWDKHQAQYTYSSEEREHYRKPRSINSEQSESSSESVESNEEWAQEQSPLNEPPNSPLLPLFVGYKGQSAKKSGKFDVVAIAQKLAQQIGRSIENSEAIYKEQTLAKYLLLTKVARIMSYEEMKQVGKAIYTKQEAGPEAQAWYAYRDAIAETGTGPALLIVKSWIQDQKIEGEEAAEVISSMAQSVRQPSKEYMTTFYNLVKDKDVQQQALLNETAILCYTTLLRKVYVDDTYSHNEYPVHSFGKFNTKGGEQFVVDTVIPEFQKGLEHVIRKGDSHKILIYIRALGNIGHQHILRVFEPYLEGKKQISQFQRLQMIVALDKLVETEPQVARSVLYKVYQNQGDEQEIRVAAVYQLMRTGPSATMLQRMAKYTNIDTDEHVNAAVKSSIEYAAELEGDEFEELSENARAALPLLTSQTYGADYSGNYLRSYVQDEMNFFYKQTIQVYGSQDSLIPKGLKYSLRTALGGAHQQLINVQGMVSSIDELTNVFERQTERYQQIRREQESQHNQAQQHPWSSEHIAKKLNIETDEREQLEATLLLQLANGVTRYFSFNNESLRNLPSQLQEIEEELREGKQIQFTKLFNRYEMAVSFPTEMAFPFIYTLDGPLLLHAEGQIRAMAEPKVAEHRYIRQPDSITAHSEIRAVVSGKVEAKLGFITPFDHHKYVCGYNKNLQVHLPIKSKFEIDLKQGQVSAELQAMQPQKNAHIFHYSTLPYTAHHDILEMKPLTEENVSIVSSDEGMQSQYHGIIGQQSGIAFQVDYASEQKWLDAYWLYEQYRRHDAISALFAPKFDETVQRTKLDVYYSADHSSASKVQFYMGYEDQYHNEESQHGKPEISKFNQLPQEPKPRQQILAKMAASGIKSVQSYGYEAIVQFDGPNKVQYRASLAHSSSPVDPRSRILAYLTRRSPSQNIENYEVSVAAEGEAPNTNGLDFVYALKFDPTTKIQADIAIGHDYQSAAKFHIYGKLGQSEERKQYIKQHPRAQECREEMRQGNNQLPACANMTIEANLLDEYRMQIKYENLSQRGFNMTYKMYNALRYLSYYNLEENKVNPQGTAEKNQLNIAVSFDNEFESANVTLRSHEGVAYIKNIRVGEWVKEFVVVHPVFNFNTRLVGKALDYDTYRPICVVDKTAANTFDNRTYALHLHQDWTVMMQYVPDYARVAENEESYLEQQRKYQYEQYLVLVREAENNKREVRLTLRTPESNGQVVQVDLKPLHQQSENSPPAELQVNGKKYEIHSSKTTDVEDGLLRVYGLPNGEVKVEVEDAFYIIYDGERVKLTAMHDKFFDAVRGLCGTFTGEDSDDFLTPKNCIVGDEDQFVASYTLNKQLSSKKSPCYYKNTIYANVISDRDAGRKQNRGYKIRNQHQGRHSGENACSMHQTQYVEQGDQICFTVRPLPSCKSSCVEGQMMEKKVPVHCVKKSNVSNLWKQQIDNGASPDFSQKEPNHNAKFDVPQSCSRN